jgi:acyl-CoA synthetase (AMP-forming)/AMP-acid ligase II
VIVRGGENMSPGEIEDVLLTHPAIADACACAIPSVEWGETVGVAIVTRPGHSAPGEVELKELVRSRLRSSRVPEKVAFVAELPYNEMGKLLRRKVKEVLAD